MIHRGLRWKIGNWENVQIYGSRWISRPSTFKILSQPTLPEEATVSVMINEEQKWDENMIKQHFIPEDSERIIQLSLPKGPELDQLVWAYDKK